MGENVLKWEEERLLLVRDLGRILVKLKAIEFGTFTLSSGKLSPYYIDLRRVPSFPDVFKKTIEAYVDAVKNTIGLNNVGAVCGVPTSGLTYATAVAYSIGKPLIYVRTQEKRHGTAKKIEGVLKPGCNVLVLDDLVTTGNALIRTVDTVRSEGGVVENAVVLIDRVEGGREKLDEKGVKLTAITDMKELTDLLYEMEIITAEQKRYIQSQMRKTP